MPPQQSRFPRGTRRGSVGCTAHVLRGCHHHQSCCTQVSAEVRAAGTPAPKTVVDKPDAVKQKLKKLLQCSVLFAGLDDAALEDVTNAMFEVPVEAGATIIKYALCAHAAAAWNAIPSQTGRQGRQLLRGGAWNL